VREKKASESPTGAKSKEKKNGKKPSITPTVGEKTEAENQNRLTKYTKFQKSARNTGGKFRQGREKKVRPPNGGRIKKGRVRPLWERSQPPKKRGAPSAWRVSQCGKQKPRTEGNKKNVETEPDKTKNHFKKGKMGKTGN